MDRQILLYYYYYYYYYFESFLWLASKPYTFDFIIHAFLPSHSRPFYSVRNARIASAVLATAIPSVRLSVTRRYCVKTTAHSTVQLALKMCLVL